MPPPDTSRCGRQHRRDPIPGRRAPAAPARSIERPRVGCGLCSAAAPGGAAPPSIPSVSRSGGCGGPVSGAAGTDWGDTRGGVALSGRSRLRPALPGASSRSWAGARASWGERRTPRKPAISMPRSRSGAVPSGGPNTSTCTAGRQVWHVGALALWCHSACTTQRCHRQQRNGAHVATCHGRQPGQAAHAGVPRTASRQGPPSAPSPWRS